MNTMESSGNKLERATDKLKTSETTKVNKSGKKRKRSKQKTQDDLLRWAKETQESFWN